MENSKLKRISCKRCQQRKIRCSRTAPCVNCSTAKVKCEFRDSDYKLPPVSRQYVAALESRISTLENLLVKIKSTSGDEREAILEDVTFQDHLPSFANKPIDEDIELSQAMTKASLQETTEGSMIYHGPTSIFTSESAEPASENAFDTDSPSSIHDRDSLHNPTVYLCLGLFFFWQYPQFMFIDREAFVKEFEVNPIDGEFCSAPLVHAGCAIGALMSPDPDIRALAAGFAELAESYLTSYGLSNPRLTSVQALLCCAYYEIGKGNLSKGWQLSGMAFRMGQDMGFQRDPTHWAPKRQLMTLDFDNEFRRRLYWGCFLSDKIFSLFLGRPTFMHENDADVDISEPLPRDPPIWENWLYSHNLGFLKTMRPAGPKLTLLFNQQVELGRIIHEMLSHTFAPKSKGSSKSKRWTEVSLNQLNAKLIAWKEALPVDMRWKKWVTNKDVLQPNVAILHTLYHSTRICLNLPFITSTEPHPSTTEFKAHSHSRPNHFDECFKICADSTDGIVEVLQRFKSQHTLGNAPIIFVHGAIVATNSVLVTSRHSESPRPLVKDTHLPALDAALQEMSASWSLAEKARAKFRHALGQRQQQQHQHRQSSLDEIAQQAIIDAQSSPVENPVPDLTAFGTPTHQTIDFASPEQYVWDPMSVIDGETAYWANMGDDAFLAGMELEFLGPSSGLEGAELPWDSSG